MTCLLAVVFQWLGTFSGHWKSDGKDHYYCLFISNGCPLFSPSVCLPACADNCHNWFACQLLLFTNSKNEKSLYDALAHLLSLSLSLSCALFNLGAQLLAAQVRFASSGLSCTSSIFALSISFSLLCHCHFTYFCILSQIEYANAWQTHFWSFSAAAAAAGAVKVLSTVHCLSASTFVCPVC